jgi:MYXO-CTERM domain-containing protein
MARARSSAVAISAFAALTLIGGAARAEDCPQLRPTDASAYGGYAYGGPGKSFATPGGGGRVWWTATGTPAPDLTSTRADGVPDAVATVGDVLDHALAQYATMGFKAPIGDGSYPTCADNGGDGRVDVYLIAFAGGDGVTVQERCTMVTGATKCPGFLMIERKFTARGYSSELEGAQTVVPHELFHLIQNAYDANLDHWWAEGSAQWATKQLYPSLLDLERNLPSYFSEITRPIDSPPAGAAAGFLYGTAIWPVFLGQHDGSDVVRKILESEGTGKAVFDASDAVLTGMGTSLADEYGTFAAWNAGTGKRTGTGGYPDAAKYPTAPTTAFPDGAPAELTGITAGFSATYFTLGDAAARTIALETDDTRLGGLVVPLENGKARVDQIAKLPATVSGSAIVVLAGRSSKKTDVHWTLRATTPVDPNADAGPEPTATDSSSGCAVGSGASGGSSAWALGLLGLAVVAGRRRRGARG